MKLLLITRYYPPLEGIATMRMFSWTKYLKKFGVDVTVLTTSKEGQIVSPLNWQVDGVEVEEVPYWDPIVSAGVDKKKHLEAQASNSFASKLKKGCANFYRSHMNERMPGRTDFWIGPAQKTLRRWKEEGRCFDVVISSYGPPAAHILGSKAKKIFGAFWLADYRDYWQENATFTGLWPFTIFEGIVEKKCVGQADAITTISDPYRDFLQKKFPHIPVHTIENGFDEANFPKDVPNPFAEEAPAFRFVYTGSLHPKTRNPEPVLKAIRELIDNNKLGSKQTKVLFYGQIADGLEELIGKYRLEGIVEFRGAVSMEKAFQVQHWSDALLLFEQGGAAAEGILTGKLFEYLYAKKPIIAVGFSESSAAAKILSETELGTACGFDFPKIKEALLSALSFEKKPSEESLRYYSREEQTKRVFSIISNKASAIKDAASPLP